MSACAGASGRAQQVSGVAVTSAHPGTASTDTSPAQQQRPVRLLLRCKYVVACAGALHTPALLLRSGVTVSGNVGANLRLHPATVVTAVFPEVRVPATVVLSVSKKESSSRYMSQACHPLL